MKILVIGQCTVHWGRMEFGNIGNYYIIEVTVRELHRAFPGATIVTTFQMTDEFCARENVRRLPMELFYSWTEMDMSISLQELAIAYVYDTTGRLIGSTPYIEEVLTSDLIVDFSGEMWGDHAELVGKNRFLIGLLKDRVAQLLKKPVVLLAGSQGPFTDANTIELAKQVFANFRLIANREPASAELLREYGFDISHVRDFACPAFLFQGKPDNEMVEIYEKESIIDSSKRTVGFVLCGFNMLEGPYDKWPRHDSEFAQFAEAVEFIVNELRARVVLLSHQNGFDLPPNFKLVNGRDYPIVKQLQSVVAQRGIASIADVVCLDRPYLPKETKAIIGKFDMFVTGRVHGFVAAVSQQVPSVLITRGHGLKSHRNIGFARSVGLEEYIADPRSATHLKEAIGKCWENRGSIKEGLGIRIPIVQDTARMAFDALPEVFSGARQ